MEVEGQVGPGHPTLISRALIQPVSSQGQLSKEAKGGKDVKLCVTEHLLTQPLLAALLHQQTGHFDSVAGTIWGVLDTFLG